MATTWEKANPDGAVDRLPQPYRSINKILEGILEAVGDQIGAIQGKRRLEEYEHALPQAAAHSCIPVVGRVTCAHVEPRGTSRLAVGTSLGEVILFDTDTRRVAAQTQTFAVDEPVGAIALSSDGVYLSPSGSPAQAHERRLPLRPHAKLLAAGTLTPKIHVYDIRTEGKFGVSLQPACVLHVPKPDQDSSAPAVAQLHVAGAAGGIWVVVLLPDRTVRVYLCPLGEPEVKATGPGLDGVTEQPIVEEKEEAEEAENEVAPRSTEHFDSAVQVNTPTYCFSLPSLAPMPSLPEPALEGLTATVFTARLLSGRAASQGPLLCFLSSTDSNVVVAYSLRAPAPAAPAQGLDLNALLQVTAGPMGELREPGEPLECSPRRRWVLPARTSAVAASPDGSIFAVGGAGGALALVNSGAGPSLRTMLPGHYAAVAALSFHRADVLISVGADSWVHHYCMRSDALRCRYLCSPPPSPPPALGIVASQVLGLALSLDASGGLRLHDLRRRKKIARVTCHELAPCDQEPGSASGAAGSPALGHPRAAAPGGAEDDAATQEYRPLVPCPEEVPRRLLATASGFAVLCEAPPAEGGAAAEEEGDGGAAGRGRPDRTLVDFFDHYATLCRLFPGLGARVGPGGRLEELFEGLSAEELVSAPATRRLVQPVQQSKQSVASSNADRRKTIAPQKSMRLEERTSKPGALTPGQTPLSDAGSAVVALTAENLASVQSHHRRSGTKDAASDLVSSSGGEGKGGAAGGGTGAAVPAPLKGRVLGPHSLPDSWQVSVKRRLAAGLAEKQQRSAGMLKRLDQIRKEIGDA